MPDLFGYAASNGLARSKPAGHHGRHVMPNQRHSYAERGLDLYESPPEATRALLKVERLPRRILEPACGRNAIVNVLRAAGHEVLATDLVDYGAAGMFGGIDFLQTSACGLDMILTNPPYRLAEEFVAHALKLCPHVVMLLRLAFLESERRRHILEDCGLARVHIFRKRLPMIHHDGWDGPKATSAIPFAWFVWNRAHIGPATIQDKTARVLKTRRHHERE